MKHVVPILCLCIIACKPQAQSKACASSDALAPASIGGSTAVAALTPILAGPDRENGIDETIRRFRTLDPTITDDQITDIMIAADCPNEGTDDTSRRTRAKSRRAEVEAILAQQ